MTKINCFDKSILRNLRDDMNAALASVADKHGITIAVGNASYTDTTVTYKIDCVVIGDDGVAKDKYRVTLENLYPHYVDKPCKIGGRLRATVVGYNSRGHKYPFMVKGLDGKKYKVSESELDFNV